MKNLFVFKLDHEAVRLLAKGISKLTIEEAGAFALWFERDIAEQSRKMSRPRTSEIAYETKEKEK